MVSETHIYVRKFVFWKFYVFIYTMKPCIYYRKINWPRFRFRLYGLYKVFDIYYINDGVMLYVPFSSLLYFLFLFFISIHLIINKWLFFFCQIVDMHE